MLNEAFFNSTGILFTSQNRRHKLKQLVRRLLQEPVHESVVSCSYVFISEQYPFIIEVMKSGKIVMEFSVQRLTRANGTAPWMYANAQLVDDE